LNNAISLGCFHAIYSSAFESFLEKAGQKPAKAGQKQGKSGRHVDRPVGGWVGT